jgi:hypothetical protein
MKKLALISLLFSLCFAAETASAICTGTCFLGSSLLVQLHPGAVVLHEKRKRDEHERQLLL